MFGAATSRSLPTLRHGLRRGAVVPTTYRKTAPISTSRPPARQGSSEDSSPEVLAGCVRPVRRPRRAALGSRSVVYGLVRCRGFASKGNVDGANGAAVDGQAAHAKEVADKGALLPTQFRVERDERLWHDALQSEAVFTKKRLVAHNRAMRVFLLNDEDLAALPARRVTTRGLDGELTVYQLQDVKEACERRWGNLESAAAEHRRIRRTSAGSSKHELRSPGGGRDPLAGARRSAMRASRVRDREAGHDTGTKSVVTAMATNGAIFVAKVGGFAVSGSASLLSEAVHSLADVANQALLYVGIKESQKKPDPEHPYGYEQEKHVFALISGVGLFLLGSGVSIYHGILGMLYPQDLESLPIALGVLGASFCLEGYSMSVAFKEIRDEAREADMAIADYVRSGSDPMNVAVLAEDVAAVAGVGIATGCLTLSAITGNPVYDAAGSVGVGLLLGGVATFLVQRNRHMLVGASVDPYKLDIIEDVLLEDAAVDAVFDIKGLVTGKSSGRFKCEISFNPEHIARLCLDGPLSAEDFSSSYAAAEADSDRLAVFSVGTGAVLDIIGDEIDRLENVVRFHMPEISHVDIEVV